MKHLRLVTILIFGILGLSLSAPAQTESGSDLYYLRDAHTNIIFEVHEGAKAREVKGTYLRDDKKNCDISGSYFPATGRVKAVCQGDSEVFNVTGFKLSNQDAFQLTIGGYNYVIHPRAGGVVEGTWHIEQRGGGRNYEGKLNLKVEVGGSNSFTGTAVWDNHQQGRVEGKYEIASEEDYVTFTIYYSEGLEGYYKAKLSKNGTFMLDGTARANKGGPQVSWEAKRISSH